MFCNLFSSFVSVPSQFCNLSGSTNAWCSLLFEEFQYGHCKTKCPPHTKAKLAIDRLLSEDDYYYGSVIGERIQLKEGENNELSCVVALHFIPL